ncbi:MAG: DUF4097 domain-containing protein [Ruminococcaceae bacterium]|nr:DUF4097 domain-containing protein [Oscillospiraceae bacterium]
MKSKKVFRVLLIAVSSLLLLAVLVGVLNALLGDGEWSFGWTSYQYDAEGYEIGGGTVYTDALKHLDIDWVDGHVNIIVCEDYYPSVTETFSLELADESYMRRLLVADEGRLTVKYRAPSSFFGGEENKQKDLTVRIPKRMLGGLESLTLNVLSSEVTVEAIPFSKIRLTSASGNITAGLHPMTERLDVETKKGDVCLSSAELPSFSLTYETKRAGSATLDFPFEEKDGRLICGEGKTGICVVSESGKLTVKREK